jgi:hypothetical protein
MKQTAVEWLLDTLGYNENMQGGVKEIIEKAKEMEREQIIAFGKKCYHPLTERKHTSDVHFECTICGGNNY